MTRNSNNITQERVQATNDNFDEQRYLAANPDVAKAVLGGRIGSGRIHFERFGRNEGREIDVGGVRTTIQPATGEIRTLSLRNLLPKKIKTWIKRHLETLLESMGIIASLKARLSDAEVLLHQIQTILRYEAGSPFPPPKHLQVRVTGGYSSDFLETGFTGIYPSLSRVLLPTGKELRDFPKILDFGCGCGRAIRALATLLPETKMFGTDIDPEAIEWLQKNYSKFAEFSIAPHSPPTIYYEGMFDLVFGISVFTHLPEDMQFSWLEELRRITKDGGYVILTTHGTAFRSKLDSESLRRLDNEGFFYAYPGFNYGKSISLPEFYQAAYHTHEYIRKRWSEYFEVTSIEELGFENHQDAVLLKKNSRR